MGRRWNRSRGHFRGASTAGRRVVSVGLERMKQPCVLCVDLVSFLQIDERDW